MEPGVTFFSLMRWPDGGIEDDSFGLAVALDAQGEVVWYRRSDKAFADPHRRICALCQLMTQKAAAEILLMPTSTLSNLLHRVITRVRRGTQSALWSVSGSTRSPSAKGRKFATLVYDLDRAQVLWVGPGQRAATPSIASSTTV